MGAVVEEGERGLGSSPKRHLENQTLVLLAAAPAAGEQSGARSVLEHLADALVCLGGALEVLVGADLLADFLTLFRGYGLLAGLTQLFNRLGVVAEILLATDKNDGQTLAEV